MLNTEEVARRLGVKPATVYAYVSRGLLVSERNADGKGSLFAEADVEAFVTARRRTALPGGTPPIQTGLTLIKDGALYFRGHDVSTLARANSYESVAMLLWTGRLSQVALSPSADLLALAEAVTFPLPAAARLTDRLRVIVAAAAAADPLRFDTAPTAVIATGQTLLATMVAALPLRRPTERPRDERFPLAGVLWTRLTAATPTPAGIAALNAALVLLADHDIAASTLAARVAASTRAHPYAVVGAGLAALDGPLHGAASGLAYAMLTEAVRSGDPMRTISDRLRVGGVLPGFGHRLYPDGDPRAKLLLALLRETHTDRATLAVIDEVAAAVTQRSGVAPDIDFAVAAFALLNDMDADAGEAIFAVARTAGWIAHALEEYSDRPSRFRPSGHYAGRAPVD
ncbi:MAG TPA: citrate synthase [Actinoplanes sp.]|nr:citrate synthase [Actinoplanes sp.]